MKRFFLFTVVSLFVLCMGSVDLKGQNDSVQTDFQKGFSITADIGGGFNKYPILSREFCPGFGMGVGMRYDFHRFWGVSAGLRFENYYTTDKEFSIHDLIIPVEMEYHLPYFYLCGGVRFGVCINTWTAANAREAFSIGGTLGLGGRIPLTQSDHLSIGVHGALINVFEAYYTDGTFKRYVEGFPRYTVMLRVGYSHRF